MKKLIILLLIGLITLPINSQSYDDASEASELCLLAQGSIGNNFMNDKEADVALDKILSVIGASKRFILQPCSEINNAVATSFKGLRYILYDKSFMNTIANESNSWSQLFILSHEVGHHINGHSIDILLAAADIVESKTLSEKRQQELESDEFAGFILGRLGATLAQTSEAINLMAPDGDDTYSTHPSKAKRLNAIKIGYDKALGLDSTEYEYKSQNVRADEYFYQGLVQSKNGHHAIAIQNFTKAINHNPKHYYALTSRASSRKSIGKLYFALYDLTKAIKVNPNLVNAYFMKANFLIQQNLGKTINKQELYEAIADYTRVLEIEANNSHALFYRGIAKIRVNENTNNDRYSACGDLLQAKRLGRDISIIKNYCD